MLEGILACSSELDFIDEILSSNDIIERDSPLTLTRRTLAKYRTILSTDCSHNNFYID